MRRTARARRDVHHFGDLHTGCRRCAHCDNLGGRQRPGTPHTVALTGTGAGFSIAPRVSVLTPTLSQQFGVTGGSGGAVVWTVDGVVGGSPTIRHHYVGRALHTAGDSRRTYGDRLRSGAVVERDGVCNHLSRHVHASQRQLPDGAESRGDRVDPRQCPVGDLWQAGVVRT